MKPIRLAMTVGAAGVAAGLAFSATAAEVTAQRLENASKEPYNWLTVYGNYSSHMYSGLNQINRTNVAKLRPLFMHSILNRNNKPTSEQATPLVEGGYMYVNNAYGEVFKVDVRSGNRGQTVWINDSKPEGAARKRGIALLGDNVFHHTTDMRLIKIDAKSGETVYEVSTKAPASDTTPNQSASGAPLAIKDRIVFTLSNGDNGQRGYVAAYKADKGEYMWRFWAIPGPGEPGHETWKDTWNAWKTGGAGMWATGSYDPETNLVYYGTGNAVPMHDPEYRPGDNLYTSSTIAVNVDTGKLAWFFQEVPNESWDWDTINPRILYDVMVDGKTRKVQGNFSRDGFFYTLDRTNGAFLSANPYVEINWTAGIDPKTGKPVEYNPSTPIQAYIPGKTVRAGKLDSSLNNCPYFYGMPTYFPPTSDPVRKMALAEATDSCADQVMEKPVDRTKNWLGADPRMPHIAKFIPNGQPKGRIVGVDVNTGKKVAEAHFEHPIYSGLLGTAGDLLFTGHIDGRFAAYDKDTLAELYSFHTGGSITAPPISYSVDGRQYIAVLAGGQQVSQDMIKAPEIDLVRSNAQIIVFGL